MKIFQNKHMLCGFIILMILCSGMSHLTHSASLPLLSLPTPDTIDMSIDEIIQKRTSVREFTDTPLTDQELSTLLWHAYGFRDDGFHTIPSMQHSYAVELYVLRQDGIYHYEPENHSLLFYASGDYRSIGQYEAPIQLGLCYNTTILADETIAGMQIGAVGQNIYHSCIAMNLGTVATGELPCPLDSIGLPKHHKGLIVMPVGHPTMETKYRYLPVWLSWLPKVEDAKMEFTTALNSWNTSKPLTHNELSNQLFSQFLWACYGYSYYLDHSGFEMHFIERHRTVPSAHGYYPLEVYSITPDSVSWYIPGLRNNDPYGLPIVTGLWKIIREDKRTSLAEVTYESMRDAPLSLLICLNINDTKKWDDLSDPTIRWVWSYEAGACIQNVLLDSAAWDYNIHLSPVTQKEAVRDILSLSDNYDPFAIISIG